MKTKLNLNNNNFRYLGWGGWAWKRPEESNNKAMHNNSRLEHEKAAEKKEKWLLKASSSYAGIQNILKHPSARRNKKKLGSVEDEELDEIKWRAVVCICENWYWTQIAVQRRNCAGNSLEIWYRNFWLDLRDFSSFNLRDRRSDQTDSYTETIRKRSSRDYYSLYFAYIAAHW